MPLARWIGALVTVAVGLHASVGHSMIADARDPLPPRSSCPYDFLSDMPASTFCVYRGSMRDSGGAVCDGDAVVIWSAHSTLDHADGGAAVTPARNVYFGFVDMPSIVVHAVADRPTRARLIDYLPAPAAAPIELGVSTTVGKAAVGSRTLTMTLPAPLPSSDNEECAAESYRGVFIGVVDFACDAAATGCLPD